MEKKLSHLNLLQPPGFHAPSTVPTQQPAALFHSRELRGTTLYRARRRVLRPWFNLGNGQEKAALDISSLWNEEKSVFEVLKETCWNTTRRILTSNKNVVKPSPQMKNANFLEFWIMASLGKFIGHCKACVRLYHLFCFMWWWHTHQQTQES